MELLKIPSFDFLSAQFQRGTPYTHYLLKKWASIIGLFLPYFQVRFLRNLASEIIIFFQIRSTSTLQLLRKLPVLFRESDTLTYAQKMNFSRRPLKH
jgi:hypothetical protein